MAGNKLKEILNLAHSETYGRFKDIIITSVIGILVNVLLGVIKIIVGTVANSVAVISDAVNNFADSVSSLVTIIAMAISGRGATRKHPFGFGRIEYFSSMIISVLILITGGEFLIESVKKILHPEATAYTPVTLVLLIVAIVAKILLGLYTKRSGTKLNSPNLIASGQDALSDAIITGVTLLAAVVSLIWPDLHIDGWVGAVVSIFVIKAGLEILLDVISKLLGERPSIELADKLMDEILNTDGVLGAYDLILHNYGPNVFIGDVNLELETPECPTAERVRRLHVFRILLRQHERPRDRRHARVPLQPCALHGGHPADPRVLCQQGTQIHELRRRLRFRLQGPVQSRTGAAPHPQGTVPGLPGRDAARQGLHPVPQRDRCVRTHSGR